MRVIVASEADEASVTIRRALLEEGGWSQAGTFQGLPAHRRGGDLLVTIPGLHLELDHADGLVTKELGVQPRSVVYISKHASESARRSFTVHPIGNWDSADFGGRPGELVPAAPAEMTAALRALRKLAPREGYEVTFEATHHGPYLSTPTFFIEVGSDLAAWREIANGRVIARALAAPPTPSDPVIVGVGGGHYVPRMTDLAVGRQVAVGHMIPSYALRGPVASLLERALAATPGASALYIHRKAVDKPVVAAVEAWCGEKGIRVVREGDLQPQP